MFLHLVVLLSLSWPHVIGNANLQDEVHDQVAIASENVAHFSMKIKDFRDQLIPSMIDTTVYENSNGFVPMLVSSTTDHDAPGATSSTEATNVTWDSSDESSNSSEIRKDEEDKRNNSEHDPAYSTEGTIFLKFPNLSDNRRSFAYQVVPNEFELLKVRNDTPIVANYPDFYEDPSSSVESSDESRSSRHRVTTNAQKMHDYGYGMVLNSDKDGRSSYEYYDSHSIETDKEKKSQEKANVNYHQQDALRYDGHGQTSTRQRGPPPYLSRSHQQLQVPVNTAKNHVGHYDSVSSTSQISNSHQKFSRPVVVAEQVYPNDHRSRQKSNSDVDDYQSSEVSHQTIRNRDGRFRSEEDSRDISDERDYSEYTERPRRVQKHRKRPSKVDPKRFQKEHRDGTDSAEYESKRHPSRSKSYRQRGKNSWLDDDDCHQHQEESYEDSRYDSERHRQSSRFKPSSSWNQVSPNLEISHSNGIEIGQAHKPKLVVPIKVNLVPVANVGHSSAIGNSQGFDGSDPVLHNIVTPINAVTTSSPVMSTTENGLNQDWKIRMSTPVPDIIVGQNNYQNSIQANLPQTHHQNNFSTHLKQQFMSTVTPPVYSVTPSLQSIAVQNVHSASTPRPTYVDVSNQQHSANQVQANVPQLMVPQTPQYYPTFSQTPIPGSNFNIQVTPHGMHGQNFIAGNLQMQSMSTMPTIASTTQTMPVTKFSFLPESQSKKTLIPSTTNFVDSQFNGHSFFPQNSYNQQVKPQVQEHLYQQTPTPKTYVQTTHVMPALLHPFPTIATLSSTPQALTEHQTQNQQYAKIQDTNKKLPSLVYQTTDNAGSYSTSTANVVNAYPGTQGRTDTAHLPYVGTGNVEILNPNIKPSPIDTTLVNSYETMHYPTTVLTTSIPMFTTTSFVTARPALFSASTTESGNVQNNQQSTGDSKAYQTSVRPMFATTSFVTARPALFSASTTESGNVQNNQQSTGDSKAYQTSVRPVFDSTSFVTARPALFSASTAESGNVQNNQQSTGDSKAYQTSVRPVFDSTSFVTTRPALFSASTAESGNMQNNQQSTGDWKAYQTSVRPVFNPINFVPNLDVIKSQSDLNSKLHTDEPLQPNLNLVPLIPGGNFFKSSTEFPNDVLDKPKLSSDLVNYADQMFKESLKTMYTTQKWNNDRTPGSQPRQNVTDSSQDIAALKNELERLKASLLEAKRNKNQPQAQQTETKVKKAELNRIIPDDFLGMLEDMYSHGHYVKNKPRYRRPDQNKHKELKGKRLKDTKYIKDFMTPPKPYRSKGHFHDKPEKKRPYSGPTRYNDHSHYHGPRSYPRHHFSHKTSGPEAFASNHDPVYSDGSSHRDGHDSRQRGRPEFKKGPSLDSYSSFSAPLPDKNGPYKGFKQHKGSSIENFNQPKMHNLLGMWMKNKRLPEGINPNYFRDQDQLKRFFDDEKQRLQKQFYDDTFKDYLYKNSEGPMSSNSGVTRFDTRRSLPRNSKV